jgi:hypothetical protein
MIELPALQRAWTLWASSPRAVNKSKQCHQPQVGMCGNPAHEGLGGVEFAALDVARLPGMTSVRRGGPEATGAEREPVLRQRPDDHGLHIHQFAHSVLTELPSIA